MAPSKKEKLLATPMHQLFPGCHTFNRWFTKDSRGESVPEAAIPTLAAFIAANQKPIGMTETFVCCPDGTGFSRQSTSFAKLKALLVKHKFTAAEWVSLANQKQLRLFTFEVLKPRSDIRRLPFFVACNCKQNSQAVSQIVSLFAGTPDPLTITVDKFLTLTLAQVESLTGTQQPWALPYAQVQNVRLTIIKAQNKLRSLGFKPSDGPLMEISFKKEKKSRVSRLKKTAAEATRFYIDGLEEKYPHRRRKTS